MRSDKYPIPNITANYCPKCGYDTLKDGSYCTRMSCGYSRALTATMLEWRTLRR